MSEPHHLLPHLHLLNRAEDRDFHPRPFGGGPGSRPVDRHQHGGQIRSALYDAFGVAEAARAEVALPADELRALGVIIVLEGAGAAFPLKLDSLEQMSRHRTTPRQPKWLLLSVQPETESQPERAVVWVSDAYRHEFLRLFEDYIGKDTHSGNPKNQQLVANIAEIRRAVLRDLWQSSGDPSMSGIHWWELWLHRSTDGVDLLRRFAEANGMRLVERSLALNDRSVLWIEARWSDLAVLPFTAIPLAEVRRPEIIDTVEDLPRDERDELVGDLGRRVTVATDGAPAVCHLDTGVRRTHTLLADSLSPGDMHSVVGDSGGDHVGHGTRMAGLALYGPLDKLLLANGSVLLSHRLESVKLMPDRGSQHHHPLTYGIVTADAAAAPEVVSAARQRVFCMPVTCPPDADPGVPTLWSAAVDALAVGTDVGRSDGGIALLGLPDPRAARLFVISAGNVRYGSFRADYRTVCDTEAIEDPAQAWNALTVGAYTELDTMPSDPSFHGWRVLASAGDVSPHSRTSLLCDDRWPNKPDICLEGGNVITNGNDFHGHHIVSLGTTDGRDDYALGSADATSAATAQAARLAALAMVGYPTFWPETIRGLLVHAAEWTPTMRAELTSRSNKQARRLLLRRYGWGVPNEDAVLNSTRQAVTLVTQDEFVPFAGQEHKARRFRLHRLPWPTETLQELGGADVALRVTLSYFVEPTASRRGWRQRYAYASHGLRFALKSKFETSTDFLARINREAQSEEDGGRRPSGDPGRWFIGKNQRNTGSLHQDIWESSGAELADCGLLAVYPISGWWKNNRRKDRADLPLRYCLVVSLRTREQTADLYTPIAAELSVPIATAIEAI